MPNVVEVEGYRIGTYVDDHPPAHVHVFKPGANLKVAIEPVVEYISYKGSRPSAREIRRALELVAEHIDECRAAWEQHHP